MSDQNKCRQISELFPLYFKSELEQDQAETMRLHLQACDSCQAAYAREQIFFALAAGDSPTGGLDSHADADLLDKYARNRDSLGTEQRLELEAHLAGCQLCREAAEKLAALPADLSKLVPTEQLPFISELDKLSQATPNRGNITNLTKRLWLPFTAIAAAAMVIIVGVTMMSSDGPEPSARVEGTFPAVIRSSSAPTVFATESESFTFVGRVYVDPEEGHEYSLLVRDVALDSLIFQKAQLVTFDKLGFATFEQTMSPGKYELILHDVVDTDSITIARLFDIRLKR